MTLYEKALSTSLKRKALHAEERVCATKLHQVCRLTLPQFAVLTILVSQGPSTLGVLANEIGATRGNLTGLVRRMDRRGLITRERSSKDERKVMVCVTEEGRSALANLQATVA